MLCLLPQLVNNLNNTRADIRNCCILCTGGMFASPVSAVGAGLHAIYMYGGLVLFGGFVLYDTQRIIHGAENSNSYDPVNM